MAEPLVLTGRLDVTASRPLYEQLRAASTEDIALDLGDVTWIGALCLQILVAASRETRGNGHDFTLSNLSAHLLRHLNTLGFSPQSLMGDTP